jgi:formate hydrogenlyase transcriptional activator
VQEVPERHLEDNIHGFDEFSRHYNALLQTADRAASERSLRELFARPLSRFEQDIPADYLALALHDPARNVLIAHPLLRTLPGEIPAEIPLERSLGALVLEDQQPIEVPDIEAETRFAGRLEIAKSGGFRSVRIVPLTTARRKIGTMSAARSVAGGFSEEDVRLLDQVAEVVSLILENALMADVLTREKTRIDTLLDVNTALVSTFDIQKLFIQISRSMRRIVGQDLPHFALYDQLSNAMKIYALDASTGGISQPEMVVPVTDCPAGIAFRSGETKLFTAADLESIGSEFTTQLLGKGVRLVLCVPMVSRGRTLGTLGLVRLKENPFSGDETELIAQVAAQIAVAVDNARAYDEIAKLKEKRSKEKKFSEDEIRSAPDSGKVIGNSPALKHVLEQVEIAAPIDSTVLILGETGTGKELVAHALHRLSARREGLFVKLHCAAIPTGLLESELFGHEKGAFTGAISQKVGRLELADKGTLFLDEIGEIPPELQPKLLRVLQDHEFERLGSNKTIHVNVRVIAATNRDLARAVAEHEFRSDLYYRLNVFPIYVPPLRDRVEDIPLLVNYFVEKFARMMGKTIELIPSEIIAELERWYWPGNIRELQNFIERSVILTRGPIMFAPIGELPVVIAEKFLNGTTLEDVEREYILRTLRASHGVIAGSQGAAARLGMKRTTLQSKIQRLGITHQEYE